MEKTREIFPWPKISISPLQVVAPPDLVGREKDPIKTGWQVTIGHLCDRELACRAAW